MGKIAQSYLKRAPLYGYNARARRKNEVAGGFFRRNFNRVVVYVYVLDSPVIDYLEIVFTDKPVADRSDSVGSGYSYNVAVVSNGYGV